MTDSVKYEFEFEKPSTNNICLTNNDLMFLEKKIVVCLNQIIGSSANLDDIFLYYSNI